MSHCNCGINFSIIVCLPAMSSICSERYWFRTTNFGNNQFQLLFAYELVLSSPVSTYHFGMLYILKLFGRHQYFWNITYSHSKNQDNRPPFVCGPLKGPRGAPILQDVLHPVRVQVLVRFYQGIYSSFGYSTSPLGFQVETEMTKHWAGPRMLLASFSVSPKCFIAVTSSN